MEQLSATSMGETLSMFVTANPMTGWQDVAKRIGGRLYDVVLANGLTHRFHANQMGPRSTQLTVDHFMAFADAFNLPIRHPQVSNGETGHSDKHSGDHNQQSGNQGTPALDDDNPEQSSSTVPEPRRSK
jgi:hypothetical protein